MTEEHIIHAIKLPKRSLQPGLGAKYRIYTNPKDYITVEAPTAAEAFRMSELPECYRIVKETTCLNTLIESPLLQAGNDFIELSHQDSPEALPKGGMRVDGMLIIHAPDESGMESVSPDQLFTAMSLAELNVKAMAVEQPEVTESVARQEVAPVSASSEPPAPESAMTEEADAVQAAPELSSEDAAEYDSMIVYNRDSIPKMESHLVPREDEPPPVVEEKRELTPEEVQALLNSSGE